MATRASVSQASSRSHPPPPDTRIQALPTATMWQAATSCLLYRTPSRAYALHRGTGSGGCLRSARVAAASPLFRRPPSTAYAFLRARLFSPPPARRPAHAEAAELEVTHAEVRRLVRLVGVEALKRRLLYGSDEVVKYADLLEACLETGAASTKAEAKMLARAMDDSGVILLFRDKAYLHPQKVADLVRRAVPLALEPENDPRKEEFKEMQERKEKIDNLAHKHVRRILWSGLGFVMAQVGLFFRLTYWEFSWDVIGPIAFFTTASGLLVGYAYFLTTSTDPTYKDFMERLFSSRQRKLCAMHKFDMERYLELQKQFRYPL